MSIPIPGPLSLGDVIDRSVRIYRARFRPMILTSAILMTPLALIAGLLNALPYLSGVGLDEVGSAASIASGFVAVIIGVVIQGVLTLALAFHTLAALRDRPLSPGDAIRSGAGRFLPWLGMSLLQGLGFAGVVALAMLPFVGLTALLALAGDDASVFAVLAILCFFVLAGLLVFAPVAFLATRWIASLPALVEEGAGPRQTLRRSWGLTKGRFWRSFGFLLILWLLAAVVSSIPSFGLSAALLPVIATGEPGLWLALQTIGTTLIGYAISALWLPLSTSAYVLYYFDLRVRQEGYDLERRIAELEAETGAQ